MYTTETGDRPLKCYSLGAKTRLHPALPTPCPLKSRPGGPESLSESFGIEKNLLPIVDLNSGSSST